MKKILCVFLFLCIAQSGFAVPSRKVLLTLNPHEEIYWGEYLSNFRISGLNFLCILTNSETKKLTLVWNGERKLIADDINVSYVDVDDFSNCIYTYKKGEKEYLQLEKETFGPYDEVWIRDCYPMIDSDCNIPRAAYINRREFAFRQMGEYYVHDNDGTIYKWSEGKYEFVSPNGVHHAKLAKDKRIMTIDDINYVLPIPVDGELVNYSDSDFFLYPSDNNSTEVCLFDDGTCYFSQICSFPNDGRTSKTLCYYITPSKLEIVDTKKDYFDLDSHSIKSKSALTPYCEPFRRDIDWNENTNEYYIAYEFIIQDKTKKHVLTAKWNYDYVLIDGKKYGNQCPIEAFYDEGSDSFCWVVVEKNQIVLYTMKV